MPFNLGPVELGLILLIVAMLFGVGKLPEVFGAVGKGVREFKKESGLDESKPTTEVPAAPVYPATTVAQVYSPAQAPAPQLEAPPAANVAPVMQAPPQAVPVAPSTDNQA